MLAIELLYYSNRGIFLLLIIFTCSLASRNAFPAFVGPDCFLVAGVLAFLLVFVPFVAILSADTRLGLPVLTQLLLLLPVFAALASLFDFVPETASSAVARPSPTVLLQALVAAAAESLRRLACGPRSKFRSVGPSNTRVELCREGFPLRTQNLPLYTLLLGGRILVSSIFAQC